MTRVVIEDVNFDFDDLWNLPSESVTIRGSKLETIEYLFTFFFSKP
jgi:hypothetical protein